QLIFLRKFTSLVFASSSRITLRLLSVLSRLRKVLLLKLAVSTLSSRSTLSVTTVLVRDWKWKNSRSLRTRVMHVLRWDLPTSTALLGLVVSLWNWLSLISRHLRLFWTRKLMAFRLTLPRIITDRFTVRLSVLLGL